MLLTFLIPIRQEQKSIQAVGDVLSKEHLNVHMIVRTICNFSNSLGNCKWEAGTANAGKAISNDYCKKQFGRPCCAVCNVYNSQSAEIDQFTWDHDDFLVLFSAGNVGQ
jgi:hypothetical protein